MAEKFPLDRISPLEFSGTIKALASDTNPSLTVSVFAHGQYPSFATSIEYSPGLRLELNT